jgi:hypothetical protein
VPVAGALGRGGLRGRLRRQLLAGACRRRSAVVEQCQGAGLRLDTQVAHYRLGAALELAPCGVGLALGQAQADEGAVRGLGCRVRGQKPVGQSLAGGLLAFRQSGLFA